MGSEHNTKVFNGNGDHIESNFTPSNYTPDATVAEAEDEKDLAAHLAGIDDALVLNALIFGG